MRKEESKSGLLIPGIIFLAGFIAASVFNYLYHLFMGRMLGPEQYGVLGSLFAIIYIAAFSSDTFSKVISKHAAEFHSKNQQGFLKYIVKKGFIKLSSYGIIILIIYILLAPYIASFLNLSSSSGVIITGVIAYFSLLAAILTGSLNGMQKFKSQNFSSVLSASLKFFLAILLVFLGLKVNGALLAVLFGIIASMVLSSIILKASIKAKPKKFETRGIYLYAVPVFLASVFSVLAITFDQILVKHFLSSADAGFYAAAGNIAKIIWFCSGFFISVMFPKVVSLKAENKETSSLLKKTLFYSSVIALLGVIFYFLFPKIIVNILYGSQYSSISPLIGLFGLGMAFFSLSQILIAYNLAIEKYNFIYFLAAGVILEIAGIIFFHDTLKQVVYIFLASNAFILLSIALHYIFNLNKNKISSNKFK